MNGEKRVSGWLWLILAVYGLLALASSVIVPLAESPDELDHFLYVRFLANNGRFPIMTPVAENNETMEANQPPLYYLLGTAVSGWVDTVAPAEMPLNACFSFDPADVGRQTFYRHDAAEQFPYRGNALAFHLVRLLSVALGAGTVALAYRLGRLLAGGAAMAGLLAAGLLALNPQFIFMSGSVNNDVLTALLGAAIVWQSVRVAAQPRRRVLLLGLLVGLGLLAKFALLALWPVALAAVLIPFMRDWQPGRHDWRVWRQPLANLLLVAGVPLLTAGWWYGRMAWLYGDPLAWEVHLQAKGSEVLRTAPFTLADLGEFASLHFRSSWGLFGWLNVQVPGWMLAVYGMLAVLGLLGLGLELQDWRPFGREGNWLARGQRLLAAKSPFLLTMLAVAAVYVSLLRYIQTINWSGYQGRLAFAVFAAAVALLGLGLWRLIGQWTWAAGALLTGLALLAGWAVFGVLSAAYPRPEIYTPPPQAAPVCARFSDGLMLDGFDAPDVVTPGQETSVTLYGYGLAAAPGPQMVVVSLDAGDGPPAAQAQAELVWEVGEVVSVTLRLPVAESVEPARAFWRVSLLDAGVEQGAMSVNGRELARPFVAGEVKIGRERPLAPQPQVAVDGVFAGEVALIGYDVEEAAGGMTVTLYWQALAQPSHDYTTFVHVLDAQGNLVAQADGQPGNGRSPTSIWSPGEIVADEKWLSLPETRPLQVMAGIYLLETGERLSFSGGAGDRLTLFFVE